MPAWLRLGPALLLGVAAAMLAALCVGRYPLPLADILRFLGAAAGLWEMPTREFDTLFNLIVRIRLPRVLAAVLVGMSLATAGAAFQGVFRNPLVSPGLLGVLAGAAFGAALGIVLDLPWAMVQLLAFLMGVAAVTVGVGIATLFGNGSVIMMVLGGVISGALFTSLLSMVKYVADPYNQLPAIVHWLMGSLALADLDQIGVLIIPIGIGVTLLCTLGRALDALTMGDDEARALGMPVQALRILIVALATLISALTVSLAGIIGWVGLIVPHIARLLVGPGNAALLPTSAALGAGFLLAADGISRTVATTEIPIGIVTELIGVIAFVLVLGRVRKGWL
ncbi:iron ABC transporter permease [Azonexus sp. R2A61]|uniref:FecCD family ABC transporter permease n=1 Tax=Azonexus sp. R2A61 TaxID=2744443 RepID=UPI001F34A58D|nr:iron ABC transporter permease [Azonexus sp. R2A61]